MQIIKEKMQIIKENYTWHLLPIKLLNTIAEKEIATIKIVDKVICITKIETFFYVFNSKCPHAGANFTEGGYIDNSKNIVCPLHGFKYNIATGKSKTGDGYSLYCYPIIFNNNDYFFGIKI